MVSVLSPLAQPFHPTFGEEAHPVVYNNGVPSLVFQGSENEFLKSFQDNTIDEAFPPNAQEAAEIEAAEIFVEMMATFDLLEEKEEATRTNHAGVRKRWEARRELLGRPRPAKHVVTQVVHGVHHLVDASEVVMYDNSGMMFERRLRTRETSHKMSQRISKQPKAGRSHQIPIHQPRKQN
jgi:hypothetical protein